MGNDKKPINKELVPESSSSDKSVILPLSSLTTIVLIVVLIYLFISGAMYRFYASALFLFYALVKKMWISVMMLGVLQTILMIPLRIIKIQKSDNIKEFEKKIYEHQTEDLQLKEVKMAFHFGNKIFLFYVLDFIIQLTTFLTIGRLFLTDFYSNNLDPSKLYNFIPYPDYPIQGVFFKIPYLEITKTISLGWQALLFIWVLIILINFIIKVIKTFIDRRNHQEAKHRNLNFKHNTKYDFAYLFILLIISWFVVRHLPTGFKISIFSGNVSRPNRTLNTITAIMTFLTLMWFGIQKIIRKGKLAKEKNIDKEIIDQTQKQMFSDSILDATLVGLGAFFITNHIPSAFELSIFTLEAISLISPFTLDKIILELKNRHNK